MCGFSPPDASDNLACTKPGRRLPDGAGALSPLGGRTEALEPSSAAPQNSRLQKSGSGAKHYHGRQLTQVVA